MKKLLSFMLLFVAVMTASVLTSCGDDNNDDKTTVAGTYTGTDSLHFGMATTSYKTGATNVQYVVTENSDNSINVTLSEETYDFSATVPFVGKIVQGSYTIKNIPYDATKKAYYLDYSNNASAHISISGMGMKRDKDYDVTLGQITVTFTGSTVTIENVHKFGSMPMALNAIFIGTK